MKRKKKSKNEKVRRKKKDEKERGPTNIPSEWQETNKLLQFTRDVNIK